MSTLALRTADLGRLTDRIKTSYSNSIRSKLEEAKEEYQKILALEPRHSNALSLLGVVYQLQNKTDEAIRLYHEVRFDNE